MGRICAVIGREAEQLTREICKSLGYRGSGDERLFLSRNLALGHRAILKNEISSLHQPLANEDESIWITLDGEIFNKESIIKQLKKNHTLQTNSCAEVIVHSYEESGFHCLSKFNGNFAFCLWDSNNSRIFSARDRLGIKPLYYYRCRSKFILASEIKGILTDPSIPKKPNERFIYEYLITGYPHRGRDTFFKGIKEVMPAHYLVLDENRLKIRKYWQPTQNSKSKLLTHNDNWYASKFLHLLTDSINIRLPKKLLVGTFLSGGLDSTIIASIINNLQSKHSPNNLKLQKLFSAIYLEPTEQGDERRYIKHVGHALKTAVNYVFPSVAGKWDNIKNFVSCIEEPVAVFNYYVFWYLFHAAEESVKTVFSGQGSDAILGGQNEHAIIYFKELWASKKFGTFIKELLKSMDWISLWLIWSFLFSGKAESKIKNLLDPQFVTTFDSEELAERAVSLQNALLIDVTQHAIEYLRVDDRAATVHSIECRHPFLDHRLVEFAFFLPPSQKMRDGWTKYVMRNAVKALIPETIRKKRKKFGTPIPQQRWMKDLEPNIKRLFESKAFRERKYFNQTAILRVFNRYIDAKLSRLERQYYANVLWRIINLELWLEHFF